MEDGEPLRRQRACMTNRRVLGFLDSLDNFGNSRRRSFVYRNDPLNTLGDSVDELGRGERTCSSSLATACRRGCASAHPRPRGTSPVGETGSRRVPGRESIPLEDCRAAAAGCGPPARAVAWAKGNAVETQRTHCYFAVISHKPRSLRCIRIFSAFLSFHILSCKTYVIHRNFAFGDLMEITGFL